LLSHHRTWPLATVSIDRGGAPCWLRCVPVPAPPLPEQHVPSTEHHACDASAKPRRRGPAEAARLVAVAFQFLTRLPVPPIPVGPGDVGRASAAFPLVGLVVGGLVLGVWAATAPLLGTVVAAILAVATAVAVTGAFHEDGLADTFDGLWGGWEPQRRIEIMRDSRVGTYGACALVLSLALRVGLLAQLDLAAVARAVLVGHVVARAAILVQIRWLEPVSDRGHGAQVGEPVGPFGVGVAATVTAVTCGAALGAFAAAPLLAAMLGVAALRRAARRRLGGLTGDVLGATQQVALLLATATVVGLDRWGAW
jgi:adenosylcobinamide-GDP ribazoletransferase